MIYNYSIMYIMYMYYVYYMYSNYAILVSYDPCISVLLVAVSGHLENINT